MHRSAAVLIIFISLASIAASAADVRKPISIEDGKKHWAFQPLREYPAPSVSNPTWVNRPIDAWILNRLDKEGLKPAPPADRRTLIRRVTFDIIGLPPTPEEVAAFEKDDRPEAYEQLVHRLLQSPHHGERWARFWLDMARYCDVPEGWVVRPSQTWPYRDWVVAAMNEDMPYDRFVRLQLAADRVADARPSDLAALTFLGNSPDYFKELQLDPTIIKGLVADEWEERVGTISGTFLGLTGGCARCHDHKFEPITMADYYALAGVISNCRPVDGELLPEPAATRVREARAQEWTLKTQIETLKKTKKAPKPKLAKAGKPATQPTSAPIAPPDPLAQAEARLVQLRSDNPELVLQAAVPIVDDAALRVVSDAPNRTRLAYTVGQTCDIAMHQRGNPNREGDVAPRRFFAVLSNGTPRPMTAGSGRSDLADAILTEAAPLTARVIVNRVWTQHFGRGLVDPPGNLGLQAERPTHPELLDDLAARFVHDGWSLRWLHREILLSSTYRQSSMPTPDQSRIDADNRLLSHMNRRRLDAEGWRDTALSVAGIIDLKMGGPSAELSDSTNVRRTIYGTVKRADMNDYLRLNDFPDPLAHCSARAPTTTPLQMLYALNSNVMADHAAAFAGRLTRDTKGGSRQERIQRAFELAYSRSATGAQLNRVMQFLTQNDPKATITDSAWRAFTQSLLGSNEFVFVD